MVWEQQHAGIPVFQALLNGHITAKRTAASPAASSPTRRRGESRRSDWAAMAVNRPLAPEAVAKAAADVGRPSPAAVEWLDWPAAPSSGARAGAVPEQGRYVQLVWLPMDADVALCWQIIFVSQARQDVSQPGGCAGGGVLIRNLTRYQGRAATIRAVTASIRVTARPLQPGWNARCRSTAAGRADVARPPDISSTASPGGWQTRGRVLGALRHAGEQRGRPHRRQRRRHRRRAAIVVANPPVFDFPLDLTLPPCSTQNGSMVNLFCGTISCNKLYDLGF
jgi:hypothetical protein